MLKRFFIILTIAISSICLSAQQEMKFSLVELRIEQNQIPIIQELGISLDCCYHQTQENKVILHVPMPAEAIPLLTENNITFAIIEDDMTQAYLKRERVIEESKETEYSADFEDDTGGIVVEVEDDSPEENKWEKLKKLFRRSKKQSDAPTAGNSAEKVAATMYVPKMQFGSMGGFYKLEELHNALDELSEYYKTRNIISTRVSIGKSFEGRDIYMIKISDNVDKDERKEEPGVLYTALHHSREPLGMMTVIYFIYYILENYEKDQRVRDIIDNRQLYFIPMINPDGYAYNQKICPNGGGMWRKNRNGRGVDLNRNYGPQKFWDYPNRGSATQQWSELYRGTKPFSEPETQAVRNFLDKYLIHTAFNYHSFSNLLLYPRGFDTKAAHPLYVEMAKKMTELNKYRSGTPKGILYPVRGYSDDYFHEPSDKKGMVFAFTPEVGKRSDGFWPNKNRIIPLAKENLEANLLLAEYAAKIAKLEEKPLDIKKPTETKTPPLETATTQNN